MPQLGKLKSLNRIKSENNNIRAALTYFIKSDLFVEAAETALILSKFCAQTPFYSQKHVAGSETIAAMRQKINPPARRTLANPGSVLPSTWGVPVSRSVAEESLAILENFRDEFGINSGWITLPFWQVLRAITRERSNYLKKWLSIGAIQGTDSVASEMTWQSQIKRTRKPVTRCRIV